MKGGKSSSQITEAPLPLIKGEETVLIEREDRIGEENKKNNDI